MSMTMLGLHPPYIDQQSLSESSGGSASGVLIQAERFARWVQSIVVENNDTNDLKFWVAMNPPGGGGVFWYYVPILASDGVRSTFTDIIPLLPLAFEDGFGLPANYGLTGAVFDTISDGVTIWATTVGWLL